MFHRKSGKESSITFPVLDFACEEWVKRMLRPKTSRLKFTFLSDQQKSWNISLKKRILFLQNIGLWTNRCKHKINANLHKRVSCCAANIRKKKYKKHITNCTNFLSYFRWRKRNCYSICSDTLFLQPIPAPVYFFLFCLKSISISIKINSLKK